LDGHFPAAEFDEFAAEFLVSGEEGSAFQHKKFNHGWTRMDPD
jgi:hypothetical protein